MFRVPSPLSTLCSAICCLAAAPAQEATDYQQALERYQECIERLPFKYHVEGRTRLAKTGSDDALTVLSKDYTDKSPYEAYSRYVLATLFGRYFKGESFVPRFAALRSKHDEEVDTWLWYETLRNEIEAVGADNAIAIATTAKKVHQRAAAITAIGRSSRPELSAVVVPNCLEFPRKDADRMLLLGALTGALWENHKRVNEDDYREALKAYISLLSDDVKLDPTAKLQMARHLQKILNGPAKFINPEPWLALLERGDVKKPKDYGTSAKPSFFGIETEGERFCYVVDMSDSMLKEIEPSARPKGPITGPKQKKKKKSMVLDEGDLPWHLIRTRWDLAREQLRISLSRLSPDKYFSIVWFGDKAGTLASTEGLVKATKSNIKKALAELDGIQPEFKDGAERLRGRTSLHYGLQVAFALAKRGACEEPTYVGDKPLTEGCDTVFLLSDGAPNWDGFEIKDKDYGEGDVSKDIERGIKAERSKFILYSGPYNVFPTIRGRANARDIDVWLLRDLERMNSFRRITVHCVGLGEANETLLNMLAELGHGEVFIVGNKK